MITRRHLIALVVGAGLMVLLGACTPTCTTDQLQAPVDLDPNGEWNVLDIDAPPPDNLVSFTWGYPISPCEPDFFEMYVWTGLEPETPGMTGRVNYDDAMSTGRWRLYWPVPLQPGNTYYWRIAACLEAGPGHDPCGPSTVGHFFTGPECTVSDVMQPVNLISPADDVTFTPTDDITFAWDDPTPCLVSYVFWIQISEDPGFNEYLRRIPLLQSVWTVPGEEIPLEECHRYYWRIKTDPAGAPEEPFSEVRSFYVQSPDALCPAVDLHAPPWITIPIDTNCRKGPSTRFGVDDTAFAGERYEVLARNPAGDWLQILSSNLGHLCWVYPGDTPVEGDLGRVPVIDVPIPVEEPVKTEEPSSGAVNCSSFTDSTSCQNAGCIWHETYIRPSYCSSN